MCRRLRTRAALQRSSHLSVDVRLHPAASVRGPSSLHLLLRIAACCPRGCVDGSRRLGLRSPVESQRWARLLQDATPGQQCTQSRVQCKENRCSASACSCWALEIGDVSVIPYYRDCAERCLAGDGCAVGMLPLYLCPGRMRRTVSDCQLCCNTIPPDTGSMDRFIGQAQQTAVACLTGRVR